MKKDNSTNMPEGAKQVEINEAEFYNEAKQILEAESSNLALYKKAQELLEQISGYKNSSKLLQECNDKILALNLKKDEAKRKKKSLLRNILIAVAVIVVGLLAASAVMTQNSADTEKYEKALQLLEEAKASDLSEKDLKKKFYNEAYSTLNKLGRADVVFNNRIDRVKAFGDKGRYDEAFSFITTDIRKDDEAVLTLEQEAVIDEAIAYVNSKILEDANAKLAAKNYYAALDLYRYLDVTDPAISDSVEKCQTESIKSSNVGDIVRFGTYEINCTTGNFDEDIEWIVVAKEGNQYMLVSKYVIDSHCFNATNVDTTWETSSVRTWLNGEFVQKAFNADELERLNTTSVDTNGKKTEDKVFLLSKAEFDQYLTDKTKVVLNTTYASTIKKVSRYDEETKVDGQRVITSYSTAWLLRDVTSTTVENSVNYQALTVNNKGVAEGGHDVTKSDAGIRPVIWVTIK